MADSTRTLQIIIDARDNASKTLSSFKSNLTNLNSDVKAAGLALAGVGTSTALLGKEFVQAAGEMEAQNKAFETLIGNSDVAHKTMKDLINFAASTPFEIPQILEQSKRLLAMGTTADNLVPTFEMLGNVASGVGMEKLPQLVLAFGQIQSKGRLMGTELRQLTEAGFNLADAMGVSNQKLDEMVTNGEVSFEDVRKAFENVNKEGGRFDGLMGELAKTTPGQLSNLSDNVFKLKAAMGEALLPAVNDLIKAISPLLQQFADFAKNNPELVSNFVKIGLALGAIGTAILIISPLVAAISGIFTLLSGAIGLVVSVVGAIVGVLGGPLTLAIVAIMALVGFLALAWKNNWGGIKDKVAAVVDWFKNTAVPAVQGFFSDMKTAASNFANTWKEKFNSAKETVQGLINKIGELISKAKELASGAFNNVKGALGFQHGGFVDAPGHQAVPAILHGGERIIPRTGTDVNTGGGSGPNVTIQITGSFNLDSEGRVQELADRIIRILGRQNELAAKGVGY